MSVTQGSKLVQDAVTIVEARSARLVKQFVELPYRMHASDPAWVPELRRVGYRRLSRRHNPFFAHADMTLFVATVNGQVSGRIAAIEDHAHNAFHGELLGWFGFFEARDAATASALLGEAERWVARRSCTAIRGPANPSLNENAGLLVDGFYGAPYVLMPHNPPAYRSYIEQAGYTKSKDLFAWDIDLTRPLGERIVRLAERVRRRHDVSVRRVNMRAFDEELALLVDVYRQAWEANWGFVPPSNAEMRQLAIDLRPVVDPDLVLFAEIAGRTVACVVGLPDVNQVLARMNGDLFPFGLWHFLNRKRIIDRARIMLLGVVSECRGLGLYPLLIAELHRRGVANGYRRAELSWTLEDNDAVNAGIAAAGGCHYKTYRLYEKPLG